MSGKLNAGEGAWRITGQQGQGLRSLLEMEHAANLALVQYFLWFWSFPTLLLDLCVSVSFLCCCDAFSFDTFNFSRERRNPLTSWQLSASKTHLWTYVCLSLSREVQNFPVPLPLVQPLCLKETLGWSRVSPADPSSAQESLRSPGPPRLVTSRSFFFAARLGSICLNHMPKWGIH